MLEALVKLTVHFSHLMLNCALYIHHVQLSEIVPTSWDQITINFHPTWTESNGT